MGNLAVRSISNGPSPDIRGEIGLGFPPKALAGAQPVDLWRTIGEERFRVQLEPLPGRVFHAEWRVRSLPGVNVVWARNSPLRIALPRELIARSADSVCFQWQVSRAFGVQLGREIAVERNRAVVLSCCDPGYLSLPSGGRLVSVNVPRDALGPLLREKEDYLARPLPDSEAVRLLVRYVAMLRDESVATPGLQQLAANYTYDLLALAIGASRDAGHTAKGRGARAAMLQAVKADIVAQLAGGKLSITDVAARNRLTVRQIQRLFESEDATFTEFICDQRLSLVYRLLGSPRFDGRSITEIAFSCGFGDISYFNRKFRERYCLTPSDVRQLNKAARDMPVPRPVRTAWAAVGDSPANASLANASDCANHRAGRMRAL